MKVGNDMMKAKQVLIFTDNGQLGELYSAGKILGEKVASLYIGDREKAIGAETVYYLGNLDNGRIYESYIPAMVQVIQDTQADIVLFGTSVRCRMMAAAVAAFFKTSAMTDASDLVYDGSLSAKRMVYGGTAYRTDRSKGIAVVCVAPGSFEPAELPGTVEIVEITAEAAKGIVCTESKKKVKEQVDLSTAKRVVCIGRGCCSEEMMEYVKKFAELTNCEIGCTRPVSDDGILSSDLYVGISGVMMKPDVYFGFGISGQIQHTVGVEEAKTLFVINKDQRAPFFKNADYGMVGSVETVLPKLVELLEAAK